MCYNYQYDLELMKSPLLSYCEKHLNKDLIVYVARDEMDIRYTNLLVSRML